jgi:translation elongation factor EF-Tu-like GTPase
MIEPLFTVESTVAIRGRGLVLVGISAEQYGAIHVGDRLVIQRPDGSVIHTAVRGVEYPPSIKWIGERSADPRYGVLVDGEDVPVGSVVAAERRTV